MHRIIPTAAILSAGALAACSPPEPEVTGRALYTEFCQSCHGADGKGGGPDAAGLARAPADLTTISSRNGGTFPLAEVMSTIDGYRRAQEGDLTMPEFGVMLEDSPVVMVDTGDGIPTPTPEPLADVAEYLRSIQE